MESKEIKEKYPKAYEAFIKYNNEKAHVPPDSDPMEGEWLAGAVIMFSPRILYDFFDGNGIFIILEYFKGEHPNGGLFDFIIQSKDMEHEFRGKSYENRIEAENDGFEKAFELLNNKL